MLVNTIKRGLDTENSPLKMNQTKKNESALQNMARSKLKFIILFLATENFIPQCDRDRLIVVIC